MHGQITDDRVPASALTMPGRAARSPFAGWGLLVGWCVMVSTAFFILFGSAGAGTAKGHISDADALAISTWLKASPDYRPGRTTVARIATAGCRCDPMTSGQWQDVQARWSKRATTLYEVAAPDRTPPSLAHVEIAIADAAGRLVYAGPFDASPMCGNRPAMDIVIASAHNTSARTAISTATSSCHCA